MPCLHFVPTLPFFYFIFYGPWEPQSQSILDECFYFHKTIKDILFFEKIQENYLGLILIVSLNSEHLSKRYLKLTYQNLVLILIERLF
jgi:hypothetical protein